MNKEEKTIKEVISAKVSPRRREEEKSRSPKRREEKVSPKRTFSEKLREIKNGEFLEKWNEKTKDKKDNKKSPKRMGYTLDKRDIEEEYRKKCMTGERINKYFKLMKYQIKHKKELEIILKKRKIALSAADTGTGKTYVTLSIAQENDLILFVVCPDSVSETWYKLAEEYGVKLLTASSYEILRADSISEGNVKWYDMREGYKQTSSICPFIIKKEGKYEWKLPKNVLIVFDESHKAKNMATDNSKLLIGAKNFVLSNNNYLLLLSATPIEKNEDSIPLFYYLNLIKEPSYKQLLELLENKQQTPSTSPKRTNFNNLDYTPDHLQKCHSFLFDKLDPKASRMSQSDYNLENNVENINKTIIAQVYNIDENIQKQIEQNYACIKESLQHLNNKTSSNNSYAKLSQYLSRIEYLKAPIFATEALKYVSQGYQVSIFVNYLETIDIIGNLLKLPYVVLVGSQSKSQKQLAISLFNSGKIKFLISTIRCGGTGISLHDTIGNRPRCSLISPPTSAIDLKQVSGRDHRTGSKSSSLQIIIYSKGSYEELLSKRVLSKLNGINHLTSGHSLDLLDDITHYQLHFQK